MTIDNLLEPEEINELINFISSIIDNPDEDDYDHKTWGFNCDDEVLELARELKKTVELVYQIAQKFVAKEQTWRSFLEEDSLADCPVCGGKLRPYMDDNGKWYVECDDCPLRSEARYETRAEINKYWKKSDQRDTGKDGIKG